jgi:SurA N-terminal domain
MIGTIRKHSKWLWIVIIITTVIAFFWWGAAVPTRNGGGGGISAGDYGSIYGEKVTQQDYLGARNDFYLYYWMHNGFQWPNQDPNLTPLQMDQQIYLRLMLLRKAKALGIYVDETTAEAAANNLLSSPDLLRAFRVKAQSIPIGDFVKSVLEPEGMTADDFERYVRSDVILQQLVQTVGMAGQLYTPQEAVAAWRRDHQEREAQVVFFSATNYLSRVPYSPGAVGEFYTNYMAYYRLPDRVQVSYVEFNVTNYFAAAEKKIGATNLDYQVSSLFAENGMDAFPGAKTPDEAKVQIRDYVIRKEAMTEANSDVNDFANAVFSQTPVGTTNLTLVANQKGLTVKTPAPFSEQYGPSEFMAPETFTKAAFALSPDDPFAGPVQGPYAYYVMVLDQQMPSEIPSLAQISDQVARDYQTQVGIALARRDGTNFVATLNLKLLLGRTFASTCADAGFVSEDLSPFSLSTSDLPELRNRAGLPQIKQTAFGTPVGRASDFEPTDDGGFIIYVEKQLPPDEAAMKSEMPDYLAQIRREETVELFESWANTEASRELMGIPALAKLASQRTQ